MAFPFSIRLLYINSLQPYLSLELDMAESRSDSSEGHQNRSGKRKTDAITATAPPVTTPTPCGACKFLRRKCMSGCIFAPHFGSGQGSARFAAVHKVFGASNVSKLLLHVPVGRRNDAVVTISYEAQARLSDPVYGCVSTILGLQQQVAFLRAKLAMVHTQLITSSRIAANAFQHQHISVLQQQACSNNSPNSNHILTTKTTNFKHPNIELASGKTAAPSSSHSVVPLPILQQPQEEYEGEDENRDSMAFSNQILHSR